MANRPVKPSPSAKKTISHKRVFTVMVGLLASLTFSAVALSLMQNQPITNASVAPILLQADTSAQSISAIIAPKAKLRRSRWNYIIVYQSGRSSGDLAGLTSGRQVGGVSGSAMAPNAGVDFHFVVDNARNPNGYPSGNIEVGHSWQAQAPAAPFRTWPYFYHSIPHPYQNAIGVCLIGNLSIRQVSGRQLRSSVALIKGLQRRLGIPNARVICQWNLSRYSQPTAGEAAFARKLHYLLVR